MQNNNLWWIHYNDEELYGLLIDKSDAKHIFHGITNKYPLSDNCISHYQAEDVLEHIAFEKLIPTINVMRYTAY